MILVEFNCARFDGEVDDLNDLNGKIMTQQEGMSKERADGEQRPKFDKRMAMRPNGSQMTKRSSNER